MGLHHVFVGTWICRRAGTLRGVFQLLRACWDGDAAREQGGPGAPMLWAPGPNGEVITEVWGWRGHPRSHPWVMKSPGGAQGTAGDTRAAEGSADLVHVLARVLSAMAGASALGTQGKKSGRALGTASEGCLSIPESARAPPALTLQLFHSG